MAIAASPEVMDGICTGCGSEVDVVLEQADGWVAGVEVKTTPP